MSGRVFKFNEAKLSCIPPPPPPPPPPISPAMLLKQWPATQMLPSQICLSPKKVAGPIKAVALLFIAAFYSPHLPCLDHAAHSIKAGALSSSHAYAAHGYADASHARCILISYWSYPSEGTACSSTFLRSACAILKQMLARQLLWSEFGVCCCLNGGFVFTQATEANAELEAFKPCARLILSPAAEHVG